MEEKNISICGLDCAKCDAFVAFKTGDNALRERVAGEWNEKYRRPGTPPIKPEDINCAGCLSSGPLYRYCATCNIRKCAKEKNVANCTECESYTCEELIKFHEHAPDAKKNLEEIKAGEI